MSNSAVKNVIKTKFYQDKEKYSIIIPAAGGGTRLKNQEPKCLVKINSKDTILSRQLDIIKQVFPINEIILVVGNSSEYIMNNTPDSIIKIENAKWEENNVVKSIGVGLRAATSERLLVVMGDLVFNIETLAGKFNNESIILGTSDEFMKTEEVGVISDKKNKLESLMIETPNKWSQIAYFTGNELKQLKELCWKKENNNLYAFEIINNIVDNGGNFITRFNLNSKCLDIDTNKDLENIRNIC